MTKALILAGCPHATVTLYRCIHLQEQLARLGVASTVQDWQDQRLLVEADSYDLLVLQRVAMTANLRFLIDRLRARGKTVIFDTDDLVFEPAMTVWHRGVAQLKAEEQTLYQEGVQRTLAALEASDIVFTASSLLAELAQRHGKPAYVHRNAVGSEMQALGDQLYARRRGIPTPAPSPRMGEGRGGGESRGGGETLIIGYGSGTPTHDVDFAETVPALLDVMARHEHVQLWLVGPLELPAALAIFGDRIHRYPLMDWRSYLELASRFDLALAPLEPGNLFCRAKSEIKFVEAGLLGIPVVASHIDPYTDVIDHGKNGLLAGNIAAWMEALEMLIVHPELRTQMGRAARQMVTENYSLEARTADLAQLLTQLQTGAPSGARVSTTMDKATTSDSPQVASLEPAHDGSFAPLVLNWIVTEPFAGAGGHLGIFRMIQHLVGFGHECHVYVVPVEQMHDWPAERIAQFVDQNFMATGATFHRWHGRVYDADATFATYWSTAYNLRELPNGGQRYYLVQDFEPYFYPMGTDYVRAENTYRLGFHCITLGPWLARLLRTQYQAQADHYDFAVDTEIYWPQPQPRAAYPRVAFYARPSTPRRAYELGIEALQQVKERCPEAEIVLYGANQLDPPPFSYVHLGVRHQFELATLYSTCDVGLVLSLTNPSFVPFEMMACKCAVVDIHSERVEGLLAHGHNALLAEPTPEGVADAILTLLWDKDLRAKITEQAYAQVKSKSWRSSAHQLERVLVQHAPPLAQRLALRRTEHSNAGALLWQIHQLLDQRTDDAAETAQLRHALQRTLAEKAQLAEELRRLQQSAQASPTTKRDQATWSQSLRAQAGRYIPAWRHGANLFSKLPISSTPLRQQFQAQSNLLCGVEVLFAPYTGAGSGAVQMALYEEGQDGQPLAAAILTPEEAALDQPYRLACPSQLFSQGRRYVFTLATTGSAGFPHGAWRAWKRLPTAQRLQLGQQALAGQLLFRAVYATVNTAPVPETPPAAMATPRAVIVEAVEEIHRLARKTGHVVQSRGWRGLLNETMLYIRWQLFHK
jgi:glycosyltransferase involved in cell wall biosynthesis